MEKMKNVLFIIKNINTKESVINAVQTLLDERIDFHIKFVDEKYNQLTKEIVVDGDRNTVGDVDIIANVVDMYNELKF